MSNYNNNMNNYNNNNMNNYNNNNMNNNMNYNNNNMNNNNMNMNNNMYQQQQPVFNQVAVGKGINTFEYNSIIQACSTAYMNKQTPYSTHSARGIKKALQGEWVVVHSNVNNKNFDFSLTQVTGGDFMSFSLDSDLFQICRLKN